MRQLDTPERDSFKNLTPVDRVIQDTTARHNSRQLFNLPSAADLNLEYVEPGARELPDGGFMARIDGKSFALGSTGKRTACKMIHVKPKYFDQFSDPMAFSKNFVNIIDNPNSPGSGGIQVRTGLSDNGITDEIAAILPPEYQIRDANEQIADLATMLREKIGEPLGISVIEQGYGMKGSYRFILGDNIMPGIEANSGQYMMFVATMSELGLMSDQTTLGLYRMTCTNGAMRLDHRELMSDWDHRSDIATFLARSTESVRNVNFLSQRWGQIFNDLLQVPLNVKARDLLVELNNLRLISSKHFDSAELINKFNPMKNNATQYDFYNLLTRAAQGMISVQSREQAETAALRLFTEPGGLVQQMRQAGSRGFKKPAPIASL